MNRNVLILATGLALAPVGCTMAPKYHRPAAPVPNQWPTNAGLTQAVAPAAAQLKWQQFFTDAKLQKLITLALQNNRDLRLATLNAERARGMYGIQRNQLLPTINANGDGSRRRMPGDLTSSGNPQITSQYDANFGVAAWELDFFGRIRSLKDEAMATYFASEEARRNAQIMLVSSVANAYLALAADRENLRLSKETLQAQQSYYDLIAQRHRLELLPDLDLYRAQTPVDTARGEVARFTQLVAQDENALNLLLGAPMPAELLPDGLQAVNPPQEISAGLPSDVLLQRPDILQAEQQLKAANADIGAARAAFFPRISLTAAIGTSSSELSGLFKAGSGAWSYAPQIVMPIFDARTWSAYKVAKAQQEIAVTQYEKAIQSAFREVADALAARSAVDERIAAQQSLVHALSETHRLAGLRYDQGIDSYLNVLDAQRSLFAAQQGLVSLRLAKVVNQVSLYAVLGGGADTNPPAASAKAARK